MKRKFIKVIETTYKGYRFRSRTEARWAVFFDTLGIDWEYEKEGYSLKAGGYLPDFYINSWQSYLEIKAVQPTHLELNLCEQLFYHTCRPIVILWGLPWDYCCSVFCADTTDSSGGSGQWFDDCKLCLYESGECYPLLGVRTSNTWSSRTFHRYDYENIDWIFLNQDEKALDYWCGVRDSGEESRPEFCIETAKITAKGARFEHGENGANHV